MTAATDTDLTSTRPGAGLGHRRPRSKATSSPSLAARLEGQGHVHGFAADKAHRSVSRAVTVRPTVVNGNQGLQVVTLSNADNPNPHDLVETVQRRTAGTATDSP